MIYFGSFYFVWKFSKNQIRLKIDVTEDKVEMIDTGFLILVGYKLLLILFSPTISIAMVNFALQVKDWPPFQIQDQY